MGTARLSGSYTDITGVGTLTAGTWNASTVAAAYGGTGQSTYAVGDILYAGTTTTLSKLADVAVGNALISGGVSSAPSWGKIGLATHVSGTLPIANGGTGSTSTTYCDLAANVTGTLPATNGGTGNASYAVGDLLYASTTTALSKLADVATGNALISGGVGVAPSYGKIGLTTHVSGTLPIANGGTNATDAATARTNLGATTVGSNMFTLTNPSAITFPRFNADNTVSALDAATFRTAIGAGTGSGTVTSVSGTGTVSGLTLSGTVTSSGNLTLGGSITGFLPTSGGTLSGTLTGTTIQASGNGVYTLGQFRATGWWGTPTGSSYSGLATEVGISSGQGYVLVYNRDTSAYGTLNLQGSACNLQISGSTVNVSSGALQQGGSQVLTAGNYTSYAVPVASTAYTSGFWMFNNMGNNHGTYTDANSIPGFGPYYLQGQTNSPGTGGASGQYYGFTLGLGADYALSSYGCQLYWPRTSSGGSPYISVRYKEGGSWGSWSKIYAGYADSAGNTSSISSAVGSGYTWTGTQNFQSSNNTALAGQAGTLVAYSTGTTGATMSFHRPGYYAINMGLDNDNVFRIGGWSASANRLQMDMSGNLTMAGNVTASSDETLKTNWRELPADFVEQLSKVKHGTYDRIDESLTQDGVSAQSLQNTMPNSVLRGADGKLSVAYGNAALVSAIELAIRVVDQEKRIARLEALVAKLTQGE